jgi:hypothetical protein
MKWQDTNLRHFLWCIFGLACVAMFCFGMDVLRRYYSEESKREHEQRLLLYERCSHDEIRLLQFTDNAPVEQ